jgi:hypothetical protein
MLGSALSALAASNKVASAGTFDVPVDASARGPVLPGASYEFEVTGAPGDRLSLATMFGMSDDWIFATNVAGIALFGAEGTPTSGDVSDQLGIYDVGTEVDEELAIGPDTGPQQPAPNTGGPDPDAAVREVPTAIYSVPAAKHVRVTVTPE